MLGLLTEAKEKYKRRIARHVCPLLALALILLLCNWHGYCLTLLTSLLPVDFGSGTKASQSRSWKQHIQNAIDDI